MASSSPAPEEAIRDKRLIADVRLAISNTPLLVPGTLFDLLCTTTYANDHTISALLHDAAVNAIAAWNRRAGGEREYTREEMREACQQNYNAGRAAGDGREQQLEAAQGNSAWELLEAVMDSQITAREDDGVTLGLIQDALDAAYQRGARAALAGQTEPS